MEQTVSNWGKRLAGVKVSVVAGDHCAICGRPYHDADYASVVFIGEELMGYKSAHDRCFLGFQVMAQHLGVSEGDALPVGVITAVRVFPVAPWTFADAGGHLAEIEFSRGDGKTRRYKTAPDSASVGRLTRYMDDRRTPWERRTVLEPAARRDGREVLTTSYVRVPPKPPELALPRLRNTAVSGDDEAADEYDYSDDPHDW